MKGRTGFWEYLSGAYGDEEAMPVLPIVELAGDGRVLVENHLGVIQYTDNQVGIKMKYGVIQICGCSLLLEYMTKTRLVIIGRIDQILLHRRG